MIAYLRAETGGEIVRQIARAETNLCVAHVLNICEVYYDFHRSAGEDAAESALGALSYAGIAVRDDIHLAFAKMAGRLKSQMRRMSLADCFAVVLAKELDAELVTADRHELEALAGHTDVKISFIR